MRQRLMKHQAAGQFLLAPLSKILLVDDDTRDLEYHRQVLEGQGHIVLACSNYADGAYHAETGSFDLAVVSQGSPAFEGRVVLERLQQSGRRTPVLVLARHKETRCYLDAMELGAVEYLEKPVPPPEMKRILLIHLQPSLVSQ